MEAETIFHTGNHFSPLGLVVMEGAREIGEKIERHLLGWAKDSGEIHESFLVGNECPRFASGDGKGLLHESVRGMDLYFIVDVGNYSCEYTMFGQKNRMSPDDHFQDLKRLIQAVGGTAHNITVIMPLLYGSRQHRRNSRESLDCAVALQELTTMGVSNIVTFDAHDARVQNSIPLEGFDNIMPHYQVLKALLHHFPDLSLDAQNFMLVSPDEGAMYRSMYYSSVLKVDIGMYYKRRDYSRMVSGRNPIIAHEYLGGDVAGKTILVTDDQLASGESSLDIAYDLKSKNAGKIFISATYALFTHGLDAFDKAYADGIVDGVFGTNLTYRTEELKQRPWFFEVDCSKYIAYIIAALNHEMSVSALLDPHEKIRALLEL
ncbi:MAG: ribose-phosphate pyrophosphokinase, partial [Oscillospiraceae bacterium]|nr:ribose-phosphate pyrophosphokinase [Oscillospiraceae bacterium]